MSELPSGPGLQHDGLHDGRDDPLALWSLVADSLDDGLLLTDGEGVVRLVNAAACRLLGRTEGGELVGSALEELCQRLPGTPPEGVPLVSAELSGDVQGELRKMSCGDGRSFLADVRCHRLRTTGAHAAWSVVVVRDVTRRRAEQLELQVGLSQADRLASVGLLAAGVAHEINNPLTYLLANLREVCDELPRTARGLAALRLRLDEGLGAEAARELLGPADRLPEPDRLHDMAELLRDALQGAVRVREIVGDLKTFSRVEPDRQVPVAINSVLEGVINMAYNQIRFRARLVKDYGRVPPVLASEGRLSQVFLNLLINATQALEEGEAEQNEIRVLTRAERGRVLVEVRDTGHGIPAAQLERVFDPFYTTKDRSEGSGLGLSICRNIIRACGGTIEIDSRPGEGTCVRVGFPQADAPAATAAVGPALSRPAPQGPRGRLLVVDDEASVRLLLRRLLGTEHSVQCADSGAAARDLLQSGAEFDVILCDLMMPRLSGMDLHEWAALQQPAAARRMVFMTGGAFTTRARRFLERVPAGRVVEKPFEAADLCALLRRHVEASQAEAAGTGGG